MGIWLKSCSAEKKYLSEIISNKLKPRINIKIATPGRTWFHLFLMRHSNLTLRIADNFPVNRAEALSQEVIDKSFNMVNLKYDVLI